MYGGKVDGVSILLPSKVVQACLLVEEEDELVRTV